MKATYFAAAAAFALAGMSDTAHAAFTQSSIDENFVQSGDTVLDPGELLIVTQQGSVDGSNPNTATFQFNVSETQISGASSGLEVTSTGVSEIDIFDVLLTTPADTGSQSSIFGGATTSGVTFGSAELFAGLNQIDIKFNTESAGFVALTSTLATVPLPAAAWLMIGGLGAVGAYGRRVRRTTAASA